MFDERGFSTAAGHDSYVTVARPARVQIRVRIARPKKDVPELPNECNCKWFGHMPHLSGF